MLVRVTSEQQMCQGECAAFAPSRAAAPTAPRPKPFSDPRCCGAGPANARTLHLGRNGRSCHFHVDAHGRAKTGYVQARATFPDDEAPTRFHVHVLVAVLKSKEEDPEWSTAAFAEWALQKHDGDWLSASHLCRRLVGTSEEPQPDGSVVQHSEYAECKGCINAAHLYLEPKHWNDARAGCPGDELCGHSEPKCIRVLSGDA